MKELLHRDGTPMRKYSSPLINELNEDMTKELNEALDRISDTMFHIDIKVKSINEKLEELIKALHDYDNDLEMFDDEPKQGACVKHDEASWEIEDELNKRMDIIGQNGNEGLHYNDVQMDDDGSGEFYDAFNDYGERVVKKDKDKSNNNSDKRGGKKSSIVEHQKYPPHKH